MEYFVWMISFVHKIILQAVLLSVFANVAFSNDTIRIKQQVHVKEIASKLDDGEGFLITDKKFLFPFPNQEVNFFDCLLSDYAPKMIFKGCEVGVYNTSTGKFSKEKVNTNAVFDSCQINYLVLQRLSGSLVLVNSHVKVLSVDSCENIEFIIGSNPLVGFTRIMNSRNVKLSFQLNGKKAFDTSDVRVFNSTVNDMQFAPTAGSLALLSFVNDTISGNIFFPFLEDYELHKKSDSVKFSMEFNDCYINCDFTFLGKFPNAAITFSNCSFGPKAHLGYFGGDKIVFRNCRNFSSQLPLGFVDDSSNFLLSFLNTDVSNIKLDFPSNVKLVFDSSDRKDAILNSYKVLLDKFNQEGRNESYKHLDIQYQEYKDSKFWNFLNRNWWNYGYKKNKVYLWTLIFLAIFYVLNIFFWKKIHFAYPIVPDYKIKFIEKGLNGYLRKLFLIFFYTIFIFFSLKIDFDKLNYSRMRYVILFFVQYLLGLFCLCKLPFYSYHSKV
jgi:hypothetical protein